LDVFFDRITGFNSAMSGSESISETHHSDSDTDCDPDSDTDPKHFHALGCAPRA